MTRIARSIFSFRRCAASDAATVAITTAVAATVASCTPNRGSQQGVGEPAPRYAGHTLRGSTFELASHRGDVVLLNVWATWCPPCRQELPELARLHRKHSDRGFSVVAVSVDNEDAVGRVRQLAEAMALPFPIVLDARSHVTGRFDIRAFPTSVLVDREGIVRWRREGMIHDGDGELAATLVHTLGSVASPSAPATPTSPPSRPL
ncbi:MAG: TlpA disulfide reductase family protein [Nannocystaceae bacterium]